MQLFIKSICFFFILFMSLLSSNIYSNDNKWNVEINLSKQNFILYEPIWLDVLITNKTSIVQRTHGLDLPNHRQFFINLKDNNGKLIEHTGWKFFVMPVPGNLLIEPDEQEFGSFDLLELYRSQINNSGYSVLPLRFPFIPIGTYSIQVNFEGSYSNEITINIAKPFGEEKEVLKLIEKASSIWVKDNAKPSAEIFHEIVEKFPNSAFAEKSFYLYKRYSRMDEMKNNNYEKLKLKKEMINKFPNSGDCGNWLFSITNNLDDNQKIETINKLLADYPNTRVAKFAKQKLKQLKQKNNNEGEIE